jgi:hypothetical protein
MKPRYFCVSVVALLLVIAVVAQSPTVETSAWNTYKNANYNFAVKYPAQWSIYEGFTKNGITMTPRNTGQFHLRPEIGVGGNVGQPSVADEKRSRNIEEDFQFGLNALKEYGNARNLTVLSKTTTRVQDLPAIESTVRYEDSTTGRTWFYKEILIHADNDSTTYHLSLRCSTDDEPTLVPLINALYKTFRILGPRA